MESGYFRMMSLVIGKVEMIGQRFLIASKPHGFQQGISFIGKLDDQFQLSSALFLTYIQQLTDHQKQDFCDHLLNSIIILTDIEKF